MKILIFIVAYNAEKTIVNVLKRIPHSRLKKKNVSILIIDDASSDKTSDVAMRFVSNGYWCDVKILRNPINQGYGGNQKIGYTYSIKNGFDIVALLHGDGQYSPELLPDLLLPFYNKTSPDAVFGSRMLNKIDALKGGMPLYKFFGNQILTYIQNKILRSSLSEFHTGYRIYSVKLLESIPFSLNTNDFHFDTEIIIQIMFLRAKIIEIAIPTFYGDEICHVNGMEYAWDVLKTSFKAKLIEYGIFFDPKFDLVNNENTNYKSKFDFHSTHSIAFNLIETKKFVFDFGCSDGYMSEKLNAEKFCKVVSLDLESKKKIPGCLYISHNLNNKLPNLPWNEVDYILLLDVIEHLSKPEEFMSKLRANLSENKNVKIILSTGNVTFFINRFMMMLGQFNYGKRGILDITHSRLFTNASIRRLLKYTGFNILDTKYIPAPYPFAIGLNWISKSLLALNNMLIKIFPGLFSYQVLLVIQPLPDINWLLSKAHIIHKKNNV